MPEAGVTREEGKEEAHFDLVVMILFFFSLNALPVFLSAAEKMLMLPFVIKLLFLFLILCSLLKSRGFYFTETCWF